MEVMGQDTTAPVARSSGSARTGPGQTSVTLDGFSAAIAQSCGVSLADLAPIEELEVHTRNSCYRITVVDPGESRVLIQGGAFFPVTCPARIGGATLGGSMLKLGWIGYGFCLEIHDAVQCIVTTPVCAIIRSARDESRSLC
jgi:hypothetical protein